MGQRCRWRATGSSAWPASHTSHRDRCFQTRGNHGEEQERALHLGRMMEAEMVSDDSRLQETRRAFNRAAAAYDGPAGNNVLIQRMRAQMWQTLTTTFPPGARLLDLGCGTGLDAAYLAARGYAVLATDWSQAMVERTRARI